MYITKPRAYDYNALTADRKELTKRYVFLNPITIGKSVEGRDIHAFLLGRWKTKLIYNAAHHGLEWITSLMLMRFIEEYAIALYKNTDYIKQIFDLVSIYVIPQLNPDGVNVAINGIDINNPYHNAIEKMLKGKCPKAVWQANVRGVDLNHNYDAAFYEGVSEQIKLGITVPGPTRYSGRFPESEPESRAMADFTREIDPDLVLAYHSQGRVIYYDFLGKATAKDKHIANIIAKQTGYNLDETVGMSSFSGYKDWVIDKLKKPGATIEVGSGENPLPLDSFDLIYKENRETLFGIGLILTPNSF